MLAQEQLCIRRVYGGENRLTLRLIRRHGRRAAARGSSGARDSGQVADDGARRRCPRQHRRQQRTAARILATSAIVGSVGVDAACTLGAQRLLGRRSERHHERHGQRERGSVRSQAAGAQHRLHERRRLRRRRKGRRELVISRGPARDAHRTRWRAANEVVRAERRRGPAGRVAGGAAGEPRGRRRARAPMRLARGALGDGCSPVEEKEAILHLLARLPRGERALTAVAHLADLRLVKGADRRVVERVPLARALARLDVRKVVAEVGGARVHEHANELIRLRRAARPSSRARLQPGLCIRLEVKHCGKLAA